MLSYLLDFLTRVTQWITGVSSLTVVKKKQKMPPRAPGIIYALQTTKNTFKVGKTINLPQRLRSYRTLDPRIQVFHTFESTDIDNAEKVLHALLKMHRYHDTHEIFKIKPGLLKQWMEFVVTLENISPGHAPPRLS